MCNRCHEKRFIIIKVRDDNPQVVKMSDDEVDQDLLSFMRAHMQGSNLTASDSTIGVLESAEYIYDVPNSLFYDPS